MEILNESMKSFKKDIQNSNKKMAESLNNKIDGNLNKIVEGNKILKEDIGSKFEGLNDRLASMDSKFESNQRVMDLMSYKIEENCKAVEILKTEVENNFDCLSSEFNKTKEAVEFLRIEVSQSDIRNQAFLDQRLQNFADNAIKEFQNKVEEAVNQCQNNNEELNQKIDNSNLMLTSEILEMKTHVKSMTEEIEVIKDEAGETKMSLKEEVEKEVTKRLKELEGRILFVESIDNNREDDRQLSDLAIKKTLQSDKFIEKDVQLIHEELKKSDKDR